MASESEVVEDYEDKQERLYVVNMVRRWQTRSQRRRPGGKRPRCNLILCGGKIRLLRGKSRLLPTDLFRQFRLSLGEKMQAGQIDIRVGGPNGLSIGLPESSELMEVPYDSSKKDAQAESTAESSEPSLETSKGADKLQDQEEVEASTNDESEEAPEMDDVGDELEAEGEETGELIPEPPKPLERMNKVELIDYCVRVTGMDADDLEPMVKREILEAIQGALA